MFTYVENKLHWNSVALPLDLPSPCWLYQETILNQRLRLLEEGLSGCSFYYSVKSQSNLTILGLIAAHKRFGADVVSGGELYRALKAGFDPKKIVFAGVGKTDSEIAAALDCQIRSLHVESISELRAIERIALDRGVKAPVSLRLNPDVEVDTHRHIATGKEENKFGLSDADFDDAIAILKASASLKLVGLQAHIGSQIFDTRPHEQTARHLKAKADLIEAALNLELEYVSLGGGFGVDYHDLTGETQAFDFAALRKTVRNTFSERMEIHFEPGRFISAPTGILLSRVRHLKNRSGKIIAIIDAAMNDLIRPMLYEAYHPILPVTRRDGEENYDIVGPVCESTDTFAKMRKLSTLAEGDWVAIGYAGAYGSCMSSNFNTRPLIPEYLLTTSGELKVIRRPQTLEQMLVGEI